MELQLNAFGKVLLLKDLADKRMQVILGNPHRQYILSPEDAFNVKLMLMGMGTVSLIAIANLVHDIVLFFKIVKEYRS